MTRSIFSGSVALSIMLLGVVPSARADQALQADKQLTRSAKPIHVATSVLRPIAASMGEIGGEYNFTGDMAAAVTFAIGPGTIHRQTMGGFESDSVFCLAAAAHFRYYALGNFDRGMFVGAETVFFYMDRDTETTVLPKHEGLWIGPTVGYKHTFDFGLALSAGITAGIPIFKADGIDADDVPGGVEEEHPFIGPILLGPNASVGYAF